MKTQLTLSELRQLNQELCTTIKCSPSKHLSIMSDKRGELGAPILLAEIDIAVGNKYAEIGEARLALKHLKSGQERYELMPEAMREWLWIGFLHSGYTILWSIDLDFEQSLFHSFLAIEAFREGGYKTEFRVSTLNFGMILLEMGLGDESIKHIKRVIEENSDEDPKVTGLAYRMLGAVYKVAGDFEQAKKYYDKVRFLPVSLKQKLVVIWQSVSCCILLSKFKEAEQLISNANELAITDELEIDSQVILLIVQAQLETICQAFEQAWSRCAKALTIAIGASNTDLQTIVKLQQGYILLAEGKIDAGQVLLETLSQGRLWSETQFEVNDLLLKLYESTGQWKAAYQLLQKTRENRLFAQSHLNSIEQLIDSVEYARVLKNKNIDLAELIAKKDELFQMIVHDLKNPLTAALTTTDLLLSYGPQLSRTELHERYRRIYGALGSSFDIVLRLTTMAEAESEDFEVTFKTISVNEFVTRIVAENAALADQKNQKLVIGELKPAQILGDRLWVQRILSNLISNALKYSLPGKRTTVNVSLSSNKETVYIEVKDEGLGFDEGDLLNVFSKYKKLSTAPTGNESSSGLGLYIAKLLTTRMGGTITVMSEGRNQGSVFVVSFPTWPSKSD